MGPPPLKSNFKNFAPACTSSRRWLRPPLFQSRRLRDSCRRQGLAVPWRGGDEFSNLFLGLSKFFNSRVFNRIAAYSRTKLSLPLSPLPLPLPSLLSLFDHLSPRRGETQANEANSFFFLIRFLLFVYRQIYPFNNNYSFVFSSYRNKQNEISTKILFFLSSPIIPLLLSLVSLSFFYRRYASKWIRQILFRHFPDCPPPFSSLVLIHSILSLSRGCKWIRAIAR